MKCVLPIFDLYSNLPRYCWSWFLQYLQLHLGTRRWKTNSFALPWIFQEIYQRHFKGSLQPIPPIHFLSHCLSLTLPSSLLKKPSIGSPFSRAAVNKLQSTGQISTTCFRKQFYWSTAKLICLCIVSDHFHTTMAKLNSCDKDHIVHKSLYYVFTL